MDVTSLRLFLRIAQRGGLAPAARDMNLSPASASARLAGLEDQVGARLFSRTTRRVQLTNDGALFLPHAEAAIDALDEGLATAGGGTVTPKGQLRMTVSASFGRMHILPLLKSFCDQYPDITLDIRLSDEILDLVEGAFDLAIRLAPLPDSSLIAKKLAADRRLLVASPDYIEAHGAPKTPEDLSNHRCIVLGNMDRWRFADGTAQTITGHIRVNDGVAARMAAEAGLGITVKSTWNAYEALKAGKLVPVLSDYPLVDDVAIWAVLPSKRLVPPKVRAMTDHLSKAFGPRPYWDEGLDIA